LEQVGHVLVVGHVQAALDAPESVFRKDGAYLGVRLRDAFGVVLLGVCYDQVEC